MIGQVGDAVPGRGRSPKARRPVLVTGIPRSGTTWLARELASRPGVALPGREPMNPRESQFALAGTLDGWVALDRPTARQQRLLRRCFRGLEPRTFGRYGIHQERALLPRTRIVVKDPFALLSVPAVVCCTGARAVVVYRHPAAVLASYRRMGWTADVEEVDALLGLGGGLRDRGDDATAMARFWDGLHGRVLSWFDDVPDAMLVSHADLVRRGNPAVEEVARRLDLPARSPSWSSPRAAPVGGPDAGTRLHNFDRPREEIDSTWRERVDPAEVRSIEAATARTWAALERRRTLV